MGWTYIFIDNPDYDPSYGNQSTQEGKLNSKLFKQPYIPVKQLKLVNIVFVNDIDSNILSNTIAINENDIIAIKIIKFNALNDLIQFFDINTQYIYCTETNEHKSDDKTLIAINKKLTHLERTFNCYKKYSIDLIPINICIFIDEFAKSNQSRISRGVIRVRFLDLPSHLMNLVINLPCIFVYTKQQDTTAILRVITQLLHHNINNSININNRNFILHLHSFCNDGKQRRSMSNNISGPSSITPCSSCTLEKQYIFDDKTVVNQLNINIDSDYQPSESGGYSDNLIIDNNDNISIDNIDCKIDKDFKIDTISVETKGTLCDYSCDRLKLVHLTNKKKLKYKQYHLWGFHLPYVHLIFDQLLPLSNIQRYMGNDIYHSYSNLLNHLLLDMCNIMTLTETQLFTKTVITLSQLKIDKITNLTQNEIMKLFEYVPIALFITCQHYTHCLLKIWIPHYNLISIYYMLIRYCQFPLKLYSQLPKLTTIVMIVIRHLRKIAVYYTKKSAITAVTLHQALSYNLTSIILFDSLQYLGTFSFEKAMVEIKRNMLKSWGNDIDLMIRNIVIKRNLFKLFSGWKFTIVKGKTFFDENGKYVVSEMIKSLKNYAVVVPTTNNKKLMKPIHPNKKGNKTFYDKVQINTVIDNPVEVSSAKNWRKIKSIKNEWKTNMFYCLDVEETGHQLKYTQLLKIYTIDGNNSIYGQFRVFKKLKNENLCGGYTVYQQTKTIIDKIKLNHKPLSIELIKYSKNNLFILHPKKTEEYEHFIVYQSVLSQLLKKINILQ